MTPVVTTSDADEDVRVIQSWSVENRTAAPMLFLEELAEAFSLLSRFPAIGHRYPYPDIPGLRRVLLRASRYHVYYVFGGHTVTVLAVWSTVRGHGPDLGVRWSR